jgi:hypothetical protein|tara:strand:+ start:2142 stop:2522 length:381 start_codon:yes stop_codon:yes gene_type:complete
MEFFIKQNATLPTLKLQVVKDGRNDFRSFMETLQNAIITFSMVNTDNGILKIASKPAYITEKFFDNPDAPQEFYIYYNFTANDTKTPGRYMGEFSITTTEGELIVPIRESLFINITPSFIKTQYCC